MRKRWVLAAAALLLSACQTPPKVPQSLQPEDGLTLSGVLHAVGVQVYECRARAGGAGHEWAFVAPEAELFGPGRRFLGRHDAGPHWAAPDGSKVVGVVQARADAPSPGSIPWLLLKTRSVGGPGALSEVRAIQRVNTAGGATPRQPCGADNAGQLARVPYTADYRLFAAGAAAAAQSAAR
jgi:hypothetical protein